MKYERWSPGYWLLKQYIIFAHWLVHRQIVVTGRDNLPRNKPVIFTPNHQNALSDPLAVLCNVPFQPVWLARADIFRSKVARPILKFLKIMPVYRMRDGKENLVRNDETFNHSVRVLKHNKALALFPEAAHSGKRQMLPHKKAVPRIVFLAQEMSGFTLDVQIVPVGIYYSHYWNFGRRLLLNIGKPLPVKNYDEIYRKNPQLATIALRNDLYQALLPLVLQIESKTNYDGFEALRTIYSKKYLKKQGMKKNLPDQFKSDQQLMRQLDELEAAEPDTTGQIAWQAVTYLARLRKLGLRDWLIDPAEENPRKLLTNLATLLLSAPLFLYGLVFNAPLFLLLDRLVRKKIKDPAFWSSFTFVAGIVLFPLVYLLGMLAVSPLLPGWLPKLLFLVSLPFAGKLAFAWYIGFLKTAGRLRWWKIKRHNVPLFNELTQKKQVITNWLDGNIR